MKFMQPIPLLRIFSIEKAREFYIGYLGFEEDWSHRFEDVAPVYLQVSKAGLRLHLTEHHGDCCPGATVFVPMTGLLDLHRSLEGRRYPYLRPSIQRSPWGADTLEVLDPFGNRLRFSEDGGATGST
jgi:catechol 2,3-dioxygenase-like lactoylglutathione lyase family enzyme